MAAQTDKFDPYHKWLGIPPEEQPPSHYRLLGLRDFEGDADVISHAADRAMAHIRTFHNGPRAAWSQRLLNELAAARVCLLDVRRKEIYDQSLRVKRGIQSLPRPLDTPPAPTTGGPEAIRESQQINSAPAEPIRALVTRRRARRRARELASFIVLLVLLIGVLAVAWVLFRNR